MPRTALQQKAAEMRNLASSLRRAADELTGVAALFDAVADRLPSEAQAAPAPERARAKI